MNYSRLRQLLNIKIDNRTTDDELEKWAFTTHFLQTIGLDAAESYRERAINVLPREMEQIDLWDVPMPPVSPHEFTFIDLFAGIGGTRIAFENIGGKCVFSSEFDKYAQKTYEHNFGEVPFGDITRIPSNQIPRHDILVGGFPCQAFSISGRRLGFEDTRGTLFFEIARIIRDKQPSAFFLENVGGLLNHDGGRTIRVILNTLREDLGYFVPEPELVSALNFGLPQRRSRVFIVGFHPETGINEFQYPVGEQTNRRFIDVMEEEEVSVKYYLSTTYLETLRRHRARHEGAGNGFGYTIIDHNDFANTLVTGGMGRERNLIVDNRISDYTPITNIKGEVSRENVRRMTPREWARLQGFPDHYEIPVSDAQAYKQFGNTVAINAVQATARELVTRLLQTQMQGV